VTQTGTRFRLLRHECCSARCDRNVLHRDDVDETGLWGHDPSPPAGGAAIPPI